MSKKASKTAGTHGVPMTGISGRKLSVVVTFFLTAVSAFLIFFRFGALPANLAFDEVEFARIALSLRGAPYQVYTTLANGHATLYYYVILGFFEVLGTNAVALRLAAALSGIGAILMFYTVLRKCAVSPLVAFTAPLLVATMRWYYGFARFSFEATFLLLLELTSLYFLLVHRKSRGTVPLLISAVFAGLVFHSYQPGRIFFLLPLSLLFVWNRRGAAIFGSVFLVVTAPLLIYFSRHPDTRIAQLTILGRPDMMAALMENIKRIVLMFFTEGDGNGRHNFPFKAAVNPVMSLLAVSGAAISAWRRDKHTDFLFASFFVLALIPSLFTVPGENPNMLRTFSALPAIAYFAARSLESLFRRLKTVGFVPAVSGVVLIIALSAAYDARTYFLFQSRVSRNAFEVTCPLEEVLSYKFRTLGDLPNHCRVQKNEF